MSNSVSNNKRIAKNTLFLYMRTIIIMLVSLYTSRVVLQVLGETDFGIYNVVGSIVVLFSFLNYALSTATQRFLSFYIGQNDIKRVADVFSMSITSYIFIIIIIVFFAETIGLWFLNYQMNIPSERMDSANLVYQMSILVFCVKILRVPYQSSLIAYEKMDGFAYISLLEAILSLATVYFLYIIDVDKLILYALTILLVACGINLAYYIYCKKNFTTCNYKIFWDKFLFFKLTSFSGWSMLGGASNVVSQQGLSVIVNIFTSVVVNAALGIASTVASAVNAFVSNFQTAFVPQLVKNYANENKGYFLQLVMRSSRYSFYLIFIIGLPIIFYMEDILKIWLVDVPKFSVEFTQLMLIYCMIDALSGPLWYSVQATGTIKNYQIIMSAFIILNLPVSYLILKSGFSPIYAIFARVVINFIVHFVRLLYLGKLIEFPCLLYIKDVMFNTFIITVVSIPLLYYIHSYKTDDFLLTLSFLLLSSLTNIVIVLFLGIKKDERTLIFNSVKKYFYEK